MKKRITGSVLSAGAIVLGLAAVGCGGAIENAANGWAMLGYTLLAIVLGCAALALAGLGLVAEQRKEPQKIHKVPENTVTTSHRKQNLSVACGDSSPNRGALGRGFVFRNDRWRSKTNACRRANRSEAMMTERLAQQGKSAKGANYETGKDPGRLCPV